MTGPKGNSAFCFPETLDVPQGEQNSLFRTGPVIKCFVTSPNSKIEKMRRRNRLLDACWFTNLPRFQGARPGLVRVQSFCFPREFIVSFDPPHVTRFRPILVGRYNKSYFPEHIK